MKALEYGQFYMATKPLLKLFKGSEDRLKEYYVKLKHLNYYTLEEAVQRVVELTDVFPDVGFILYEYYQVAKKKIFERRKKEVGEEKAIYEDLLSLYQYNKTRFYGRIDDYPQQKYIWKKFSKEDNVEDTKEQEFASPEEKIKNMIDQVFKISSNDIVNLMEAASWEAMKIKDYELFEKFLEVIEFVQLVAILKEEL
jgi:hypothetical protein